MLEVNVTKAQSYKMEIIGIEHANHGPNLGTHICVSVKQQHIYLEQFNNTTINISR
jgi:hypothetical protein